MNYALIGCGRIATNHMKAAVNNKLNIVAVCDVLPEAMEALLAKHGLENDTSIKRYTDYKQMIAENDITLASIATESGIHAEIALHCIDNGVNVIIEWRNATEAEFMSGTSSTNASIRQIGALCQMTTHSKPLNGPKNTFRNRSVFPRMNAT